MTFFMDISVKGFSSRNLLFSFISPPPQKKGDVTGSVYFRS